MILSPDRTRSAEPGGGMWIGIDNGLAGGIAYLHADGGLIATYPMPISETPHGRIIDARELARLIPTKEGILGVCLERPAGAKDSNAVRSMADSFATIRTVLLGRGFRDIEFPTGQQWQRKFWTKGKGPRPDYNTKAEAARAAAALWPGYDFRVSRRAVKAHDGMVDAALIAEYLRSHI